MYHYDPLQLLLEDAALYQVCSLLCRVINLAIVDMLTVNSLA